MAVKSAYREKAAEKIPEPVEPHPEIEINDELPPAAAHAEAAAQIQTGELAESEAVAEALTEEAKADQAKNRLQEQIAALREAEGLQRQHQEAVAVAQAQERAQAQQWAAMNPEEKIDALQAQGGVTAKEADWLKADAARLNFFGLAQMAAAEAMRSNERDSPGYFQSLEENFTRHLRHLQAQGAAQAPEFFKPTPPKPDSVPSAGYYTSAPVSRDGGASYRQPTNPSQVKLTPDEVAAAQAAGVTLRTYAEGKLRLALEKKQGLRQ
jgi:hypothetical protein